MLLVMLDLSSEPDVEQTAPFLFLNSYFMSPFQQDIQRGPSREDRYFPYVRTYIKTRQMNLFCMTATHSTARNM